MEHYFPGPILSLGLLRHPQFLSGIHKKLDKYSNFNTDDCKVEALNMLKRWPLFGASFFNIQVSKSAVLNEGATLLIYNLLFCCVSCWCYQIKWRLYPSKSDTICGFLILVCYTLGFSFLNFKTIKFNGSFIYCNFCDLSVINMVIRDTCSSFEVAFIYHGCER